MIPKLGCYTCLPVFFENSWTMLREVNSYSVIILLGHVSVYMKMYWTVITKRATLYIPAVLVTSERLRCTGFAGLQLLFYSKVISFQKCSL